MSVRPILEILGHMASLIDLVPLSSLQFCLRGSGNPKGTKFKANFDLGECKKI
jgi:hypothetical protein